MLNADVQMTAASIFGIAILFPPVFVPSFPLLGLPAFFHLLGRGQSLLADGLNSLGQDLRQGVGNRLRLRDSSGWNGRRNDWRYQHSKDPFGKPNLDPSHANHIITHRQ